MALYQNHFSHSHLKNYAIIMGSLLDGIDVVRYKPDGTEDHRVRVALTYSPKEKFIRRLVEDPDLLSKPAITMPVIGYEMVSMQYAPERKISNNQKFVFLDPAGIIGPKSVYSPVPYDMVFEATIAAKTQEDMMQIVEQIVPFFAPDFTVSFRGVKNPNTFFNVPITLDSVQRRDNYEGRFEDGRVLVWSLVFIVKGYFFGPVRDTSVIKHIDLTIFNTSELNKSPELRNYIVDYDIEPFIDGVPLADINFDDDYSIKTTVTYG
jgi:hypothetical protein